MPYVNIDIDLDDIDTDDIVDECCRRLSAKSYNKGLSDVEKKELKDIITKLCKEMSINTIGDDLVKTLDDKIKAEHFIRVFNKYTVADIERLLPE